MGFNWVTFFAQIVNLFVLVWLLKRFLYHPILLAIEKRQAYIEDKVKKADEAAESAEKQEATLHKKIAQWERDKQKRLDKLDEELEIYREKQTEIIQDQIERLRERAQDALNRENASLRLEIRDMMAQNFAHLSRQILKDLSGLAPVEQTIALFQAKIKKLNKTELKNIQETLKKKKTIHIISSDTLPPSSVKALETFLKKEFGSSDIVYSVQPDLILGIEAVIGETVLEWNLKTYLDTFEGNLKAALAGLIIKE